MDLYGRPRLFWTKVLDDGGRKRLVENIVTSMGDSPRSIQDRMIAHWFKVHEDFGRGVAAGLGIDTTRAAAE